MAKLARLSELGVVEEIFEGDLTGRFSPSLTAANPHDENTIAHASARNFFIACSP